MTSPQFGPESRRATGLEILIVLGLSLGASAVYSVVDLLNNLTLSTPLASQTTTLNGALSDRPTFDLLYRLLAIFFAIVPVVLAFYLLWRSGVNPFRRLGVDLRHPVSDLGRGLFLVLVIGVPGIALYFVGRALGITVNVNAAPELTYWWTAPVLVLSALRAALTEELIVVGYLYERLARLGWRKWTIILSAAVLRGSYHLYQGFGPFIGNVVMGVVFGWLYLRWGRILPLVIAHWCIDIASFVGYAWALATFPQFF
ncbi:CPBP family intramembrane metalloprotease domain-containing protein [Subtercola sp. Z020]|uniref:CPBP family intramembrane glutamic endopeptidase n=1 Tax=Subtercola sp. Z020 TaxID=2080582 RepID=UPI000CE7A165|nr:CPBP family intramembrane glutamic endopeptidase [Subtercola sp. Z020]PPF82959.1 CPBP family intramembrane metalloprotease domain-containing protein [Subtercola sp. Z020]